MRWLDGITDLMGMSLSRLQELAMDREAWVCCHQWGHKVLDTTVQVNSRTLKIPFSSKDPHPLISKIRNLGMLLDLFLLPTLYGICTQSCLTLQPHGLQPTRLLCPWNFPDKNAGVGCHFSLQGIFLPSMFKSISIPCQFYLTHIM